MNESKVHIQRACATALDRLAALLCSDKSSSTFGCVDRDFWAYKTVRGFASAPYQHVMSGLAYLAEVQVEFQRQNLRADALGVLDFWIRSRNTNGSANEWYRNEQSYCATAMGLHSATETLWVLKSTLSVSELNLKCEQLRRSDLWLRERSNPYAANQNIASCAARYVLGTLLADSEMQQHAVASLHDVVSDVERKGYLAEYSGVDLGYSLLSIDLLVAAHQAGLTQCEPLVAGLCWQLSSLAGSRGDLPFVLGSRGTTHKFFGGVHYFANVLGSASLLRERALETQPTAQAEAIARYDDRYLATFGFSALARRLMFECKQRTVPSATSSSKPDVPRLPIKRADFAGGSFFTHVEFGHGIHFVAANGNQVTHLGYVFTDDDGRRWSSLNRPAKSDEKYAFTLVSDALPLERFELGYRLLFAYCRAPFIARLVSWWARTRLGRPNKALKISFRREVMNSSASIEVRDQIRIPAKVKGVITAIGSFPYHSPSFIDTKRDKVNQHRFTRVISQVSGETDLAICWRVTPDGQVIDIMDS